MKKLFTFFLLLPLVCSAATIHWFSDETDTTTMPSNFIFAVENPGPPQGYRSVRWGTLVDLIGTSTNYLQSLYITSNYVNYLTVQSNVTFNGRTIINNDLTVVSNIYVNNEITTNLTVINTNYVNYEITTNLTVVETNYNNWNITTNLTVLETNYNNYNITTNLTVVETNYNNWNITTNLTVINTNYVNWEITTNLTVVTNAYITEVFVGVETITNNLHAVTNAWDGPTNPLPMHLMWQAYRTFTPCEITGITGKSNYVTSATLLSITNASDSNITLYLPADVRTGDGARSYIITNAEIGKLSVEYDPNGATNAVYRMFY